MPNAQTKAAATSGEKKERKAPVRKGPKLSDYPSKVAYLKAQLEFEEAEQAKANQAKVARLDKRIASAKAARDEAAAKVTALEAERQALVPSEDEAETPES